MYLFYVSFIYFSCMVIPSSSQSLVTLDCGGIVGRYVTVIHPDIPPPLCEVEVYSTWENPQNTYPQQLPPSGKQIIQFNEILLCKIPTGN